MDWSRLFHTSPNVGKEILGYVSNKELGYCRETCHNWSMFIDEQQIAWQRIWSSQESSEFSSHNHPLLICAFYGQSYVFQELAKNEFEKNPECVMGLTPLHFACQRGHTKIAHYILDHIKDFKDLTKLNGYSTYSDVSPLHLASEHGLFSVVKRIIENLEDKFPLDGSGKSPMHHAVIGGSLRVFKLLHSNSKEINPYVFYEVMKTTLLHIAVIEEQYDITKFILEKLPMSQRNLPDKNGYTPLVLANRKENDELVNLIKSFIELPFDNENPLHVCEL